MYVHDCRCDCVTCILQCCPDVRAPLTRYRAVDDVDGCSSQEIVRTVIGDRCRMPPDLRNVHGISYFPWRRSCPLSRRSFRFLVGVLGRRSRSLCHRHQLTTPLPMKFVLASVSALGLEWMSDSVARVDDPAVVGKDTVTVLSEYVVRANPRELAAMSFDWIFSRRAYF